jgi:transcriptional regulator with XRE-family HTH domain
MAQIVPVQCFLARTALGWNLRQLARASRVSAHTIARFERGIELKASTVEVIQHALETAGVVFIDESQGGPGARLRSQGAERER